MRATPSEADVLGRVLTWATNHPLIRAVVLESSRASEQPILDRFSDYDILLIVSDVRPFADDDTWQQYFAEPLVRFGDAVDILGFETYFRLTLYQDHTKIDYAIWPLELLQRIVERQETIDLLDWGYRVLLDKDGLAAHLPLATRTAYIPAKPTEKEYLALVEEFWWETTYAAKHLWRDELLLAKYNLEVVMKYEVLLRMLEWRIELDHNWMWKPGVLGRGLKHTLPPDLWSALDRTYVGPEIEDNWEALFAMTALFRRVALEVGQALGYTYPQEVDRGVSAYLEEAHNTPR
ncbi:MAG TPA: aminoglycoside 6-adenylyltransferase [Ktedonobacterales bacterium]|nr:aminoglycoside 6-adenylyltransferase [Ktedonobacterales bacterium]